METFFEMLTYRRPMDSDTEERFIEKFLAPLGVERDGIGNLIKKIGDSNVLWSSHTDTVHAVEGMQALKITDRRVSLPEDSTSNCLGADCTTGVYIMTEMIKANRPGLYVFHRGEERGSKGSKFIAREKTLLEKIDIAIAFDRYGNNSVITHQGNRCCSDAFAQSVSDQLPFLKADSGGIFTDTANYDHIVSECTNLSVGYDHHHTSAEFQDLEYLDFFIGAMKVLDTNKLTVSRDPSTIDYSQYHGWGAGYDFHNYGGMFFDDLGEEEDMLTLIRGNPKAAMSLMKAYGITASELLEHCYAYSGR